jgi:hypothetical protein
LLITADAGGSNGHRSRVWVGRATPRNAAETGLVITVCHFPPGTDEMEQDRAPAVQPHHQQLAGQATTPATKSSSFSIAATFDPDRSARPRATRRGPQSRPG